jgi:hypothetical protein
MGISEIAKRLHISRETVRTIIDKGVDIAAIVHRSDQKQVNEELLKSLYLDCSGYGQRIYEKLTQEHGISIGYSTLTRLLREHGLTEDSKSTRCYRVPDRPGAEMQHDTSDYHVKLSGNRTSVIASLLYFRYCKQRYLKFYPFFNRPMMKYFFYESLTHFGYSAPICVIDNTHVVVLHGTGKNAVFCPEMIAFAKIYGFEWLAHAVKHSDRKAGEERSFHTVETNFFPGRKFSSLEDLNEQALLWSTQTMPNRPQTKAKIIPRDVFELEKPYLTKLPEYIPEPYQLLDRDTDQYGYTPVEGNHYWVPGKNRPNVRILRYRNRIEIFRNRVSLAEYLLPPFGTHNQKFPEGKDAPPRPSTSKIQPATVASEENAIKQVGQAAQDYLEWLNGQKGVSPGQKARLIRELFRLKSQLSEELFLQVLTRARQYLIIQPKTIDRIAVLQVQDVLFNSNFVDIGDDFKSREIYQDGKTSAIPDLSCYSEQEHSDTHKSEPKNDLLKTPEGENDDKDR